MEAVSSSFNLSPLPPVKFVKFYECIEACFECANSSWICADACLHELNRDSLKQCIDVCLRAAETCAATARLLAGEENMNVQELKIALHSCIEIVLKVQEECSKLSDLHEHCLISSQTAQACFSACERVLQELKS